jgi:hypothetical protein
MILYYAIGGGLGHLTRGRRVLQKLGLAERAALVTASPFARDPRVTGGLPVIEVPTLLERDPAAHWRWLREVLAAERCERLLADTFPAGIHGELAGLNVPVDYVGRILRWPAYLDAAGHPEMRFETSWLAEELTEDHDDFVRRSSGRVALLDLYVDAAPSPARDPYWLLVHSGPEDEVHELIGYTQELRELSGATCEVLVATRVRVPLPPRFALVDVYPVTQLLAGAERIVSAAGFNIMSETAALAAKHDAVPMERRFDDQFLRAARRRALTVSRARSGRAEQDRTAASRSVPAAR